MRRCLDLATPGASSGGGGGSTPTDSTIIDLLAATPYATYDPNSTRVSGSGVDIVVAAGAAQTGPFAGYTEFYAWNNYPTVLTDWMEPSVIAARLAAALPSGVGVALWWCDTDGAGTGPDGRPMDTTEVGDVEGFAMQHTGAVEQGLSLGGSGPTNPSFLAGTATAVRLGKWLSEPREQDPGLGTSHVGGRAQFYNAANGFLLQRNPIGSRYLNGNSPVVLGLSWYRAGTVASGGEAIALDYGYSRLSTARLS